MKHGVFRQGEADFDRSRAVEDYLLHRHKTGVSWPCINGAYSALLLFYTKILGRKWDTDHLPRPRTKRSLPKAIAPPQSVVHSI